MLFFVLAGSNYIHFNIDHDPNPFNCHEKNCGQMLFEMSLGYYLFAIVIMTMICLYVYDTKELWSTLMTMTIVFTPFLYSQMTLGILTEAGWEAGSGIPVFLFVTALWAFELKVSE